ncbi:hypothetical protein LTR78_003661 [Recurvomyces mirabilis]|uniref:Uncharacterized protein n=1 Tax=Recurvomyces mirabilis TaxID=574656 RepID=A0AAE0WQY8_9PEZI|nr:hypothetical protein LTR78_003661 [Recurvomyces mirabilis]KAK5154773.1 hypothetical protein LTS14_006354 [Recurvomyces mirabilis]
MTKIPHDLTPNQLLTRALTLLTSSFINTLHFLLAATIVLLTSMAVASLIARILEPHQHPSVLFYKPFGIKPVPLIASTLAAIFLAIQVGGTVFMFVQQGGEVSLADLALTNMVVTLGMEGAALVVLGGLAVLGGLVARPVRVHVEVEREGVDGRRASSRGARAQL